jgi:hypothetical protein
VWCNSQYPDKGNPAISKSIPGSDFNCVTSPAFGMPENRDSSRAAAGAQSLASWPAECRPRLKSSSRGRGPPIVVTQQFFGPRPRKRRLASGQNLALGFRTRRAGVDVKRPSRIAKLEWVGDPSQNLPHAGNKEKDLPVAVFLFAELGGGHRSASALLSSRRYVVGSIL